MIGNASMDMLSVFAFPSRYVQRMQELLEGVSGTFGNNVENNIRSGSMPFANTLIGRRAVTDAGTRNLGVRQALPKSQPLPGRPKV